MTDEEPNRTCGVALIAMCGEHVVAEVDLICFEPVAVVAIEPTIVLSTMREAWVIGVPATHATGCSVADERVVERSRLPRAVVFHEQC
jgi:hypothetical protein